MDWSAALRHTVRPLLSSLCLALTGLPLPVAWARAQAAAAAGLTIGEALVEVREPLIVASGTLGGSGGALIRDALRQARYVAVGEDHVTREIPRFVEALCSAIPAADLSAIFVEAGPEATRTIEPYLKTPERLARMAAFNKRYPAFVAFLDTRADNDMLASCAKVSRDPMFRIHGLDQEFIGAGGFLLDGILAEKLRPAARAAVLDLKRAEEQAQRNALASGKASELFMLTVDDAKLGGVANALERGGTRRARHLFAALRESVSIYAKNRANAPDSNLVRALLMKRNLAALPEPRGKAIFKFGDWHLYKGVNPLGERDLGNYLAERAEGRGLESLHILVLGAQGVHAIPAKFGQPFDRQAFRLDADHQYRWFAQAADRQLDGGWTLFDLRALRHRAIAGLDNDWRRVVYGYDFLVVIPELSPSELIVDASKTDAATPGNAPRLPGRLSTDAIEWSGRARDRLVEAAGAAKHEDRDKIRRRKGRAGGAAIRSGR